MNLSLTLRNFVHPLCNFVILLFSIEDSDGQIDIRHIFHENGPESDYFISGPPAMIKSFKQTLIDYGISASHLFTDNWE